MCFCRVSGGTSLTLIVVILGDGAHQEHCYLSPSFSSTSIVSKINSITNMDRFLLFVNSIEERS